MKTGKESTTLSRLVVGMSYEENFVVDREDSFLFSKISHDYNPIHTDEEYAKETIFGRMIAPGMLTASFISGVLGSRFPGNGTIYVSQSLEFKRPAYYGEKVKVKVTVLSRDLEKKRVSLDTLCTNEAGKTILTGVATIIPPLD